MNSGGLQNVDRAQNIGFHITLRRYVTEWNRDECSQMQDAVTTLHHPNHLVRVTYIAWHNLQSLMRADLIEGSPIVSTVVPHQRANARARFKEGLHQMAADESASAGDEHELAFECL